jgi:hypothetical protein
MQSTHTKEYRHKPEAAGAREAAGAAGTPTAAGPSTATGPSTAAGTPTAAAGARETGTVDLEAKPRRTSVRRVGCAQNHFTFLFRRDR